MDLEKRRKKIIRYKIILSIFLITEFSSCRIIDGNQIKGITRESGYFISYFFDCLIKLHQENISLPLFGSKKQWQKNQVSTKTANKIKDKKSDKHSHKDNDHIVQENRSDKKNSKQDDKENQKIVVIINGSPYLAYYTTDGTLEIIENLENDNQDVILYDGFSYLSQKEVEFGAGIVNSFGKKKNQDFSKEIELTDNDLCELDAIDSKNIDIKSEKKEVILFTKYPVKKTFILYDFENQILTAEIHVHEEGTIQFEWYRKNPNDKDFIRISETNIHTAENETVYNTRINLPKNNYTYSEYKCRATFTNTSSKVVKETEIIEVNQTIKSGIPILRIDTENSKSINSRDDYLYANLRLTTNDFATINLDKIQIKGRGNSTWSQPKRPYTLKFSKKIKILGMEKSKKWVLIGNYSDKSLLRNEFASYMGNRIMDNMGWNPSFKSVELVLNNEYRGTYIIGEQIRIEESRVNIQNVYDTIKGKGADLNHDGIVNINDGGFLVEINRRLDEKFNFTTKQGLCISLKEPNPDDFEKNSTILPDAVADYIKNIIQEAENILFSDIYRNPEIGYTKYLDVDSFIDWYIINEFTKNIDSILGFSSAYMYYNPENQKIIMGPNWDFDISIGNYKDFNEPPTGFRVKFYWMKRLLTDPAFVAKLKARWNEVKADLYSTINEKIQDEADNLSIAAGYNFLRWKILGIYIWPNVDGYASRTTYQSEVNYMIDWLNKRYDWFDDAINGL